MSERKINILVIDDEEDFSFFLKKNLERLDCYDVITAADGKEGIKQANRKKPDLIFLDILMPGINGIEVLKTLKSDKGTAAIPVIILTGNSDDDTRKEVGALAEDCIVKPAEIEVLRESIKKALANNNATKA